ncbi:hypothetical protein [Leisingera aquimarina]|uniref:hypothetical protein n=1 Tax=Leisingera aquimarina TaxID=476529 RepID=UPI0004262A9A|nr:hypothetical protein [Leisingera aquimarina]
MGWLHLVFVLSNFRTLGRLYARISKQFPGVLDQIWEKQSFSAKADIVFGPAVFAKRAMLLNVAVVCPYKLPVHLLGDDEVAALVRKLNERKLSGAYRYACEVTGFP